ncbi:hypothetical protein [Dulcicalothrix desertica]|uniref:hypothetical protein n=1 Tax=Dulcicalothrix desertica TaxID=32056 RepID=UPI00131594BE|nr:hypothetical protein [Dulcicalothrix desertica]
MLQSTILLYCIGATRYEQAEALVLLQSLRFRIVKTRGKVNLHAYSKKCSAANILKLIR